MKKITVNNVEQTFLSKDDKCPICNTLVSQMCFSWNMFHGQATSSCCGAVYQIKDYYIDAPTDEQKGMLDLFADGYIRFEIKDEWVEPLKIGIDSAGVADINNDDVMRKAKEIMEDSAETKS